MLADTLLAKLDYKHKHQFHLFPHQVWTQFWTQDWSLLIPWVILMEYEWPLCKNTVPFLRVYTNDIFLRNLIVREEVCGVFGKLLIWALSQKDFLSKNQIISPVASTPCRILITAISLAVAHFILRQLCCSSCSSVGRFVENWTGKFSFFDRSRTVVTILGTALLFRSNNAYFLREQSNIRIKVLVQIEQAGIPRNICNSDFKLSFIATEATVVHNFDSFYSSSKYFIILLPNFMSWHAHFRGVEEYSNQLLFLCLFPCYLNSKFFIERHRATTMCISYVKSFTLSWVWKE